MTKREISLPALACTSIGIVIGFLIAPIKTGINVTCGNNNELVAPVSRREKRRERKCGGLEPEDEE